MGTLTKVPQIKDKRIIMNSSNMECG